MTCPYNSQPCKDAQAVFNEDDWLASTGQVGHLFDSLAYLLQAAQEWKIQTELTEHVNGYHVQIYAMDSVFLRARGLFEFFIGKGKNYCHAQCLFGLANQLSGPPNFRQWQNELHIGAMHLQARHAGGPLTEHGGSSAKDLNQMPVDIAFGVLDVWQRFEQELNSLGSTMQYAKAVACRDKAKQNANDVFKNVSNRPQIYKTLPALTKVF